MSNRKYDFYQETAHKLHFNLLYISTSKYEGEWQSHPHTHHFSELFYVLDGKGDFIVANNTFSIEADDLIIVNPHVEHTEKSVSSNPLEYIVFGIEGLSFQFHHDLQYHDYALLDYSSTKKNDFLYLLNLLIKEMDQKSLNYEVICRDITEVLLMYIVRSQQLNLLSAPDTKMSKECGLMKRYIDTNYADNITLDTLADLTHMNKYYLVHSFTKYTGLSPINYLIQKRVQVSKDLLSSTDFSIAQISSSTGFSSQSYFSQVFKKATGMTPIQFKKNHIHKQQVSVKL